MGFWDTASKAFRAISEGKATAGAHRLAENCLGVRLPHEVATDGHKYASRMADFSSVEEMAIEYMNSYGLYLRRNFEQFSMADKKLARDRFSRAAQHISQLQSSGVRLDHLTLVPFLDHATAFGSDTSPINRTW